METDMHMIGPYDPKDEAALFALLEREGAEWEAYWRGGGREKYRRALAGSIVYLIWEGEALCGYVRCRDDDGYGVYVYDLLVDGAHRGKAYGRLLMEHVCRAFPDDAVYVMSAVDRYYEKLGYGREGTIFTVKIRA